MSLLASATAIAVAVSPHGAYAQTAQAANTANTPDNSSSDIIVTAQKRSESVQNVPISITVVSADQLLRRGVQTMQDLSQASASLEFTGQPTVGGGAFVRGIGTSSLQSTTATASVGMVLDGVVLGNLSVADIFDTERVEVLKGPQGTLFGSSVSAGVLNITTKAPKIGETSAYVNGEISLDPLGAEYSRKMLRAAINLPVSSNSALRIAANTYTNDGLSHNVTTGAEQRNTNYGVRARYLIDVNDRLTFNLIGDYTQTKDSDAGGLLYRDAEGPLAQALMDCGVKVGTQNLDSCSSLPRYGGTRLGGVSGQFDLGVGENTLTSITSYRASHADTVNDILGVPPQILRQTLGAPGACNFVNCAPVIELVSGTPGHPDVLKRSLLTQELRLTSPTGQQVSWVAGLFYQHQTFNEVAPGYLVAYINPPGFDLPINTSTKISDAKSNDYAAFGNLTFKLSDTTRLIGGLRFTHSDLTEIEIDPANTGAAVNRLQVKADALTFRAGIQQDLAKTGMAYLTVSSGYKPPQINDNLGSNGKLLGIKAERPTAVELGIKESLFDRRLSVDADVFYTRVENFQSQSCVPSTTAGLFCSNVNVPRVNTKGFEFEIFGRPFKGNTVNISGIYNDAKYPNGFFGADGSPMGGTQLNYAPKYKMTVSSEQIVPLTETYSLAIGADATIRAKQSMYLSSDPKFVVPAQTLVNARLSLKSSKNWSVSMFARNIGNKIYPILLFPTTAFSAGGVWQVVDPNSRRLVGLQFDGHF